MTYAIYNGKCVPMNYIEGDAESFKMGCMRIIDNGASGHVVDSNRNVFRVEKGRRKAVRVNSEESLKVLALIPA